MRPISRKARDGALPWRRPEFLQDQRRSHDAITERGDHALNIVPIGLDQLAIEPLAHEGRQRAVATLCLEGIEPAIVRARHARLELDAEQIHGGEHMIADAAAVGVRARISMALSWLTRPSRTWIASPAVPVMTFTWKG